MRNKNDLRDYQKQMVKVIKEKDKVLLTVGMGFGKTATCLTAIEEMPEIKRILIVGPLLVAKLGWSDEIKEWEHLKDLDYAFIGGTSPQKRLDCLEKNENTRIHIINRENIVWLFENKLYDYDMVIWDESSSLKAAKKKTATGNLSRFGALLSFSLKAKKVVLLTGTPAPNGLQDLFGQVFILDQNILGKSKYNFLNTYFKDISRSNNFQIWQPLPNSFDTVMKKIEPYVLKLNDETILNLPEKIDIIKYVTMDGKIRKIYDDLKNNLVLEEGVVAQSPNILINKLLQLTTGNIYLEDGSYKNFHNLKLDVLEEIIDESSENILLFYNYKHEREELAKRFKDVVFLDKDETLIRKWNNGEIKVLAIHPASAGHGLNLQYGGNVSVWLSLPWSLELYQQANKRIHRSGQKNTVRNIHLIIKNTVDEYVYKVLQDKDVTQEKIFNNILDIYKII